MFEWVVSMICPEFVYTWEVMTFILSIMSRMRLRMPSSWNRSCRFLNAFKNFCRSSWLDGVGPIFHFVTINVALFAQTKACYTLPLHAFLGRSVYFHTAQQCQIAAKSSMQLMHLSIISRDVPTSPDVLVSPYLRSSSGWTK